MIRLSAVSVLARHLSHIPLAKSEYHGKLTRPHAEVRVAREGCVAPPVTLRALRVRLAITPTHPHHMGNRSTRSVFQDGIVLLRKVG
ncbi:protein of unknown function [Methanoculleus bourgensis]|uniref:Uncharacterized protein n=1 Tax=Methanoculleus bourgensis TaxID=83986 RepID=A0A0X3BN98_9EURY|nr:protein of unknown function [Methanoculleus bourgensis]